MCGLDLMGSLERSSSSCLELTMAIPGLSSSCTNGVGRCKMRDLDINQPAKGPEEEEDQRSLEGEVVEVEEGSSRSKPSTKKLCLSAEQFRLLEESYRQNHNLNYKQKEALAAKLKLRPRQVEVWFQNRRARTKLKQTEVDREYLKSYFGSLTEENRQLKREVEELRALRVAPPAVLAPDTFQPTPASSLTMCPRCQQITTTSNAMELASANQAFFRSRRGI